MTNVRVLGGNMRDILIAHVFGLVVGCLFGLALTATPAKPKPIATPEVWTQDANGNLKPMAHKPTPSPEDQYELTPSFTEQEIAKRLHKP